MPLKLACLIAAGCAGAPAGDRLARLRPGSWVAAKGALTAQGPLVNEIDAEPRDVSDTADKVEITSAAESELQDGSFRILGHAMFADRDTEYEDQASNAVPPFPVQVGQWLRVKARLKDDGLHARTIRAMAPRDQFKVVGEVSDFERVEGRVRIGGVSLRVAQDADLELLGGPDPSDPLAMFLADDQKTVPFSVDLGGGFRLGGQASVNAEREHDFDLDRTQDSDRTKLSISEKLDLLWLDHSGSYALLEATGGWRTTQRQNGPDDEEGFTEVTRAFASVRATDGAQVLVGRQDFDEEREWLYDEVLDGVRFVGRSERFEFELSASRGRELLAEDNPTEDTGMLAALARARVDDIQLTAYVLQRTDDTAAGFEPLLFGLRSYSRPRYGLGHWLELAAAHGNDGPREIDGWAFDVGLRYTFDAALRPALAAGYAFGNGRPDAGTRAGFRQTGLQDNNAKIGGVTSVRYYGELLEPELANLGVVTLAATLRPLPDTSASLIWHHYRQDVPSVALPLTELRTSPAGSDTDLGHELDIVLSWRAERSLTLEVIGATFWPGDAFAERDPASKLELTFRWSF